MRATSRITGSVAVPAPFFSATILLLRDGAEPVDVHDRDEWTSLTTYVRGDGERWMTFVCCGPDAPLPNK